MKASIIIPAYRRPDMLLLCLDEIARTLSLSSFEVIVQDDASLDMDYLDIVRHSEKLSFPVRVGRNKANVGFPANCNIGASKATGEYLVFLNQDCFAYEHDWLDYMLEVFEQENVGIVGPKLIFPPGTKGAGRIQSCGGLFDVNKGPFHRHLGIKDILHPYVNTTKRVSWTTGAALMIRKAAFEAVGGFDETYGIGYFEDVDLCLKVKKELHKDTWYCAEAVLFHSVGSAYDPERHGNVFLKNSKLFHDRWDEFIVPDVADVKVDY